MSAAHDAMASGEDSARDQRAASAAGREAGRAVGPAHRVAARVAPAQRGPLPGGPVRGGWAPLAAPVWPSLVAALLRPDTYPHQTDDLRLVETHISWVVLAGPYAYKLKKPVDFGFLDYSTVERRAAMCADEVRLNRRLCPDVYLGVVQLCAQDGCYRIGGPGRPVEPLVKMRRLPDAGMLPHLLARGAADRRLVQRIARRLARFHAAAATGPGVDEYGALPTIRANWEENFAQTARFTGRTLPLEAREAIAAFVWHFLDTQADLFTARVAAGRVRDGHGDLHAASICIEGRRVHLFDCIEFSARYRCADVAAEVAFLAMDLDAHGRADLADGFVHAYVRATGDTDVYRLLRFYTCYRAFVRGKVLSFRLDEPGLSAAEEARRATAARAYFDLAWAYARSERPLLLAAMGLPASGKTTLAAALARRMGLVHLSSDVVRKALAGLPPTARHRVPFGQGLYGPAMTRRTYAALRRAAGRWLRAGRSVVIDATFGDPRERAALRALAARTGARLVVLHCTADEAILKARLGQREQEPHAVSDARLALWPELRAAFTPPDEMTEARAVDTSASPQDMADRVVTMLLA